MKKFTPPANTLRLIALPFLAVFVVNSWFFSSKMSDDNRPGRVLDNSNIIYEENFRKLKRGTTETSNWKVVGDERPKHYEYVFEVNARRFQAKCLMKERSLDFEPIDISGFAEVSTVVNVHSKGFLNDKDYIELVTMIDGQEYRTKLQGDCDDEQLKIVAKSGQSLDIQLNFKNDGYYESYGVDLVQVIGSRNL